MAISSRSVGARSGLFPSRGSPAQRYPTGHRSCDSSSPACGSCRGRLVSLSPSSALMSLWRGLGDRGFVLLLSSRVVRGSVGGCGCLELPSVELCFLQFGYSSPSWCLPIFPVSPFLSPLLPVFRPGFSFGYCVGGSSHVGGNRSCFSFYGCLLLLVLALVAVSSCPPLCPSAVRFRFAFLVRIPPSGGSSALVFGRSLGFSVTVRCLVLLTIVWDLRLCFPFFLSFSGWSSASVESLVPPRRGLPFGPSQ